MGWFKEYVEYLTYYLTNAKAVAMFTLFALIDLLMWLLVSFINDIDKAIVKKRNQKKENKNEL